MLLRRISTVISNSGQISRLLSTTQIKNLDQKWREQKGLEMNPNSSGVLTDGPDYSYLDGRLTPYGANQKKRILQQQEIAEKIIHLSNEVDFAVERHQQIQIDEQNRRKEILDRKFKPKGDALLRK